MRPPPPHSWFPFILAALTVSLLLVIVAWVGPEDDPIPASGDYEAVIVSRQDYEEDLEVILEAYAQGGDADLAYSSLVDMSVPSGYKDLHLDLVIVFGFLRTGDEVEGDARLDVLHQEYPWLP